MNRRNLIQSLAMTLLTGSFCLLGAGHASAASPAATATRPLAVGQSLRYDSGLKLTFVKVKNDSRCPIGVFCITAGDADVVMIAKVGNQPDKIIHLHTHNSPTTVTLSAAAPGTISTMKSYTLKIDTLTPFRRMNSTIKQSDYRVSLDIQVAN